MTKQVRVENADTSSWKVLVEVWDRGLAPGDPDRLSETIHLDDPAGMAALYIHSHRYLIVKEDLSS